MTGILFCFGLGYSARTLARRLAARGWEIRGTTRRPEKAAALAALGWRLFPFSRERPLADPAEALGDVTHVLTSIAPDEAGDPGLDLHGRDLEALPGLGWVGYLALPRSTATGRVPGSTRTRRSSPRSPGPTAGPGPRPRGWHPGCPCTSSASPASTVRGGTRSST